MPEMYDYARESLIPKPDDVRAGHAVERVCPDPLLSRRRPDQLGRLAVLDLAASQGKLDELAAQVDAARKTMPGWTAGDMIRALIDCRLGRFDQAAAAVRRFLDQTKDDDSRQHHLLGRRRRARGPWPNPRPGRDRL